MARLQGISGGLSGKMGSVVFRQRGGETIATQYQPQVKNPNTAGQQNARAAFKLIAQLAAIMAPGFGTLGVTKRGGHSKPSQRNGFTQLNYPLIETATEDGQVVAKIPMEQLKLTSSFRNLGNMGLTLNSEGQISVAITNIAGDVASGRLVLVGYASMGVQKQAQIIEIIDVPAVNGRIDHDFDVPQGDYTVLAYGLIPTSTTASSLSLDNIHTPADEDFISAVALDALVQDGQLVETTTIGDNISVQF